MENDKDNFSKIATWNYVAGVEVPSGPNANDPLAVYLVEEESQEFLDAWNDYVDGKTTFDQIAKEAGDNLFVAYGAFYRMGLDANVCINEIIRSNFSKFCQTEKRAEESKQELIKNGRNADYRLVNGLYVLYDTDTGKVLKGLDYSEADFSSLKDI